MRSNGVSPFLFFIAEPWNGEAAEFFLIFRCKEIFDAGSFAMSKSDSEEENLSKLVSLCDYDLSSSDEDRKEQVVRIFDSHWKLFIQTMSVCR